MREYAKGNLRDKRYAEAALLHSGTGGHTAVYAVYLHPAWTEVTATVYLATIKDIFNIA